MINRIEEDVSSEARIQERVKENKQVAWFVNNTDVRGIGRIRNISTSGMLLETEQPIDPAKHKQFTFAADLGHENFVPQRGRLVWAKPKSKRAKRFLCGVRFEEPSDYILPKLEDRVQKKIQTQGQLQLVNKILDWTLFTAILGMTGYTIWMSVDTYQHMQKTSAMMEHVTTQQAELISTYKDQLEAVNQELTVTKEELVATTTELTTVKEELVVAQQKIAQLELDLQEARLMYNESEQMVAAINKDLEVTRQTLAETQAMLQNALASKTQIEGLSEEQQQQFESRRVELTSTVSQLETENEELKNVMRKLESQLAYYQGDIKNTDEGELLIKTYKNNIKLVKSKIKQFRRDAKKVLDSAQGERDRLQMILGNNGYFVKNGENVVVDEEKYIAAGNGTYTGDAPVAEAEEAVTRKVDVNVEFVEK